MYLYNINNANRIIQLAINFSKAKITLPRAGTVTKVTVHSNRNMPKIRFSYWIILN